MPRAAATSAAEPPSAALDHLGRTGRLAALRFGILTFAFLDTAVFFRTGADARSADVVVSEPTRSMPKTPATCEAFRMRLARGAF